MPHNFRLTGNFYVSKDGNDANPGTDPNFPKASITSAATAASAVAGTTEVVIVVGSGVYFGAVSITRTNVTVRGDGVVIIDGRGSANYSHGLSNQSFRITNIIFRDIPTLSVANILTTPLKCEDVTFIRCSIVGASTLFMQFTCARCIFVDTTATRGGGSQANSFTQCLFLSTSPGATNIQSTTHTLISCYVDGGSIVRTNTAWAGIIACDIQGTVAIDIPSTSRMLYRDRNGNTLSPTPPLPDIIDVIPTIYTNGSFSDAPEFFNVGKGDYLSVLPTSPLLRRGQGGTNIGNVVSGTGKKYGVDVELTGNATIFGLTPNAGDLAVTSANPGDAGTILSAPILLSPTPQVVGRVSFSQALTFDLSSVAGSSNNKNVPVITDFSSGTAGANPQRLTYEMRWTDQPTAPVTDAGWTNNGYTAPGEFVVFQLNSTPRVNNTGKGNGDPAFDIASSGGIAATWVQIRVRLQNGLQ